MTWEKIVLIATCALSLIGVIVSIIALAKITALNKKQPLIVKQDNAPALKEKAPVVATKAPIANAEEAVTFSADKGLTLEDKYLGLDKTTKKYYDAIADYASAVEGSKRFKNLRYEEYKIGSLRIVRMLIKRGGIVCEFMMQNQSFKSYVMENKISAKQSATVIKVVDESSIQVIKDTIDIVVKQIAHEKELKKQIAREKRKAKRQESK